MEATVYIEGEIVPRIPVGDDGFPVFGSFTTLGMVRDQLEWRKPYDSIKVIINSPGGDLVEGFAIYDLLMSQTAPVATVALGQCSSIATAIFLAGSSRLIHEHTEFHVHLPAGGVVGTAADVQAYAAEMARAQQQLIDCYVKRAGVAADVITPLMAAETTLPPAQVKELGFATAIIQPVTALAKIAPRPIATKPAEEPTTSFMKSLLQQAQDLLNSIRSGKAPIKALAVSTSAGGSLNIETGDRTEPAEGDMVTDDSGNAVADGDHTLADGTVITTAAGKITKITAPASASKADDKSGANDDVLAQVLGAITALNGKVDGVVTDVKALKTANAATDTKVQAITAKYDALAGSTATGGKAPKDTDASNTDVDKDPAQAAADARKARRQGGERRIVV